MVYPRWDLTEWGDRLYRFPFPRTFRLPRSRAERSGCRDGATGNYGFRTSRQEHIRVGAADKFKQRGSRAQKLQSSLTHLSSRFPGSERSAHRAGIFF